MKAAVFREVGKPLAVENVPDPRAGAEQLVLKVARCGICGTDLHSTRAGGATVACGSILGHEFVGEVVEVGSAVRSNWQAGERACAMPFLSCGHCESCSAGRPFECALLKCTGIDAPGAYAEYVTTSARDTLRLPDTLDYREAALIEPLAVGLHALRIAGSCEGRRVLVVGAGPIGLAVSLWARTLGARDVLVSEFSPQRRALAAKLGASGLIDPRAGVSQQFADAAGGAPELIFECVGNPGVLQHCIDVAGRRSRIVEVGYCDQEDRILPVTALVKELEIRFAIAYTRDDFATVIEALAGGRVDASEMITDEVSLEELPGAFEALRTPSQQCKVLVRPGAA